MPSLVSLGKRELVALLILSSVCHVDVNVLCNFLTVPWVGLQCVIVAFPCHTHLLCDSIKLRYSFNFYRLSINHWKNKFQF